MRAVFLSILLLAGCSQAPVTGNSEIDINGAADRAQDNVSPPGTNAVESAPNTQEPLTPAEPGQPGGLPDDRTPVSEAPAAPGSGQEAANLVQTYYVLLEARKYAEAYALWGDRGDSGPTAEAFAAGFANYSEYHANTGGPGEVEGAAGSRYVSVPVQVYARLKDGRPEYRTGTVALRRSEVDGATPTQRKWRIYSVDLKPAPGGKPAPAAVPAAAPATTAARYRCMDGNKVALRFDNAAHTATLNRDGKQLAVLAQQQAASGIWYKSDGYEFRSKGDAATLTTPGRPPIACVVIR